MITLSGASVINTTSALATNYRTYPNSVAISVAGGQNNSSIFLLDGGINMDPSTNVPMPSGAPRATVSSADLEHGSFQNLMLSVGS